MVLSFLTDNRLRELVKTGYIRKDDSVKPCLWVPLSCEVDESESGAD
jgi:hypothetical protein